MSKMTPEEKQARTLKWNHRRAKAALWKPHSDKAAVRILMHRVGLPARSRLWLMRFLRQHPYLIDRDPKALSGVDDRLAGEGPQAELMQQIGDRLGPENLERLRKVASDGATFLSADGNDGSN